MSRYEALRWHLAQIPPERTEVRMSFADIEAIVGSLPPSARHYREWWANGGHSQAFAWLASGWKVDAVNLKAEIVVFGRGKVVRQPIAVPVVTQRLTRPADVEPDQTEAAVQAHVVTYLTADGWHIQRVADTASREQGHDILATKGDRTLAVEVKGFPSRAYADPRRAGETKPTNPNTQARHWYAQALMKAVLTRDEHDDFDVMMAFPDMPTYRSLWRRTATSLATLRVGVLFVTVEGHVIQGEREREAT